MKCKANWFRNNEDSKRYKEPHSKEFVWIQEHEVAGLTTHQE